MFTLPYDSINEDIRESVTVELEKLQTKGAQVFFCQWNIGDPERTTTAVNVWYSFHGKFIVTDQSAIGLSANLTQQAELDAILVYRNELSKIQEFNTKFDELKEMFVVDDQGYKGTIRRKILETGNLRASEVFSKPRSIQDGKHDRTWILQYPPEICCRYGNEDINERLYVTPFDVKGRDFLMKVIDDAEVFVYISAESFTDNDFPNFLKKVRLKEIDIKILAGAK